MNLPVFSLWEMLSRISSLHSNSASDQVLITVCLSSFPAFRSVLPACRNVVFASSSFSILLRSSPSPRPQSSSITAYLSFLFFLLFWLSGGLPASLLPVFQPPAMLYRPLGSGCSSLAGSSSCSSSFSSITRRLRPLLL